MCTRKKDVERLSCGFEDYYSVRTWECNFIIRDGRKTILAVQVSYDISSQKTKNREIVGLLKTAKKDRLPKPTSADGP